MTTTKKRVVWPKSQIVNSEGDIIDFSSVTSGGVTSSGIFLLDSEGNITDLSDLSISSAGGGGGDDIYDNIEDFNAVPTVGTKDVVISGLSFTLEPINVIAGRLIRYTSSGVKVDEKFTGLTISGSTITFQGIDNFVADDTVFLELKGPDKSRDVNQDAGKVLVENAYDGMFLPIEEVVDETNLAINTYYKVISMEGYRYLTLQLYAVDATGFDWELYITNDASAAVPATGATQGATWFDVTSDMLEAGASDDGTNGYTKSWTAQDTKIMPDRYLIKYTNQTATNSINAWIRKYN